MLFGFTWQCYNLRRFARRQFLQSVQELAVSSVLLVGFFVYLFGCFFLFVCFFRGGGCCLFCLVLLAVTDYINNGSVPFVRPIETCRETSEISAGNLSQNGKEH